jgi:hypothetical protein
MVTYEALLKVVSAGEYPEYRRVPGVPGSTGEYPEYRGVPAEPESTRSTTSSVVAADRDNPSADDAAWASGDGSGNGPSSE